MHKSFFALRAFIFAAFFAFVCIIPWELWFDSGISLSKQLHPPSFDNYLGTDHLGRDVWFRLVNLTRNILLPLWLVCGLCFIFGIMLCFILLPVRQNQKWLVKVFEGPLLFLASTPILLACFFISIWFEKTSFLGILLILGSIGLIRGYLALLELFLKDQSLGYWQAHQVMGGGVWKRIFTYGILQAWRDELTQRLGLYLQLALVVEVSLSYLGFGVPEPQPSLGNMIAGHFELLLKGHAQPVVWILLYFLGLIGLPHLLFARSKHAKQTLLVRNPS